MHNNFFKKLKQSISLEELVKLTSAKIIKKNHLNKIAIIKTLDQAKEGDLSFLHSSKYLEHFKNTKASFCFIEKSFADHSPDNLNLLIVEDPYYAYTQTINYFFNDQEKILDNNESKISKLANIHPSAIIGENSIVKSGAYIGKNVIIGKNSFIGENSVIKYSCKIGDNALIKSCVTVSYAIIGDNFIANDGAKVGQDGFGFCHHKGENHKIQQLGIVEIGNDVEIGANTTIDRGSLGNTTIGHQTKIDNLVQIAHNVKIGRGCFIAGLAGVAGSSKIGNFVQIGGAVRVNGHIEIGDGAKISGSSTVIKNVLPMQTVAGYPAMEIRKWHKMNVRLGKLLTFFQNSQK